MSAPPTAAPAKAAAPAPIVVPVNGTMSEYKAPEHVAAVSTPTVHTHTAAAMAAARAMPREGIEAQQANVTTEVPPPAPVGDPSEAKTPPLTPKPPEGEAEKPDSPTARIAQLTRAKREADARERAAVMRAESAATEAAAAKKEAAALATIREAFKKDPLQAFKELGENWADIVDRVASGGVPPTPEQVAQAEKERAQAEVAARLKALEDERQAEKTDAQKRAEAAAAEGAIAYVVQKLITADKYPKLMTIAEDAAQEALTQVDAALAKAHREGKRSSPNPTDMDESLALTHAALAGLNNFYSDLVTKISGSTQAAPVVAAPVTQNQAVSTVVAESKQRGPDTITNAVAGASPPAAQPRHMTPDEARIEVMRLARAMPR